MSGPATYSIITDFFEKKYRIKAFFLYAILIQLGDTLQYASTFLISHLGWRKTWMFCGVFGIVVGISICIFVIEPARVENDEEAEIDEISDNKTEAFMKKTTELMDE